VETLPASNKELRSPRAKALYDPFTSKTETRELLLEVNGDQKGDFQYTPFLTLAM